MSKRKENDNLRLMLSLTSDQKDGPSSVMYSRSFNLNKYSDIGELIEVVKELEKGPHKRGTQKCFNVGERMIGG